MSTDERIIPVEEKKNNNSYVCSERDITDVSQKSNILVSIILPIYNQEKWLEQCLNTILVQLQSNMELILVDDGSTDSTPQIVEKYSSMQRVNIVHQENGGAAVARNTGLDIAKGEWISFIDPDDYIRPNYFKTLLSEATNDPQLDIISCSYQVLVDDKLIDFHFFDCEFIAITEEDKKPLFNQLLNSKYGMSVSGPTAIGVPWGKLYRRTMLEENRIRFNPKLRRVQDNVFNMHAFLHAKKIRYINECLYVYSTEHINLFYQKFNGYAYENFRALAHERSAFFTSVDFFNDSEIKRNFYCAICAEAGNVIRQTIRASEKSEKIKSKYIFKSLMEDQYFNEALIYLRNEKRGSAKEKMKNYLLNSRSYMLIRFTWLLADRIKCTLNILKR